MKNYNYRLLLDIEKEAFIQAYAIYIESILTTKQEELQLSIFDILSENLKKIHDYVIFDKQSLLEDCKSLNRRILVECGYMMQEYDIKLRKRNIYRKCYNYIHPALSSIRFCYPECEHRQPQPHPQITAIGDDGKHIFTKDLLKFNNKNKS